MRNKVAAISVIFILLIAGVWIATHGFVEVNISNAKIGTNNNYTILNKDGDKVSSGSSSSSSIKKLLPKGDYQILIESNNSSYFSVSSVKGFLSNTSTIATLNTEKYREFVGNNPNLCMYYGQSILYSYICNEPNSIAVHLPATKSVPTTTRTVAEGSSIPLIGMVSLEGINKILTKETTNPEQAFFNTGQAGSSKLYKLNDIDQQLRLSNPVNLQGLGELEVENIINYQSGFIVYGSGFKSIKYFPTPKNLPSDIKIDGPDGSTNNPADIKIYKSNISILFNDVKEGGNDEGLNSSKKNVPKGKSEVIVYSEGSRKYKFDKLYTSGGVCGEQRLCLINSATLDIYDTSGKEPNPVLTITGANAAFGLGKNIIIASDKAILNLDAKTLAGSETYRYSGYQYCGIVPAENGYIICAINNKDKGVALYVDESRTDTDSIDKKVLSLLKDPNVNDVSAYGKFIYISPNLGEPIYNSVRHGFTHDPNIKNSTNNKINELVQRVGINRLDYTVINTQM
jgi:hypothetical protein